MTGDFISSAMEFIEFMQEGGHSVCYFAPEDGDGNPFGAVIVVTGDRLQSFIKQFRDWEENSILEDQ